MHRLPSRAPVALALVCTLLAATRAAAQEPAPAPPDKPPAASPDDQKGDEDETDAEPNTEQKPAAGKPAPKPSDDGMDEELSDEELNAELEAEATNVAKPPAKGKGVLSGVVKDASEHDTLPEAQVTVPGTKFKTVADFDGRFRLELPPGTYTVRVFYELHRTTVIKGVHVVEGKVLKLDVELLPDEAQVDTVEVVADVERSTVQGQLIKRQKAASIGDGIGRAEISRTPASNAAQAAQRVVGATIVG
ncbi:MAG TPA: carboxypeptidase-like regulatory domain-containing protein, partial [Polyangiaceae bacterium]|nr:carboxypeptidase-like regulatory domain-containing protein [Polyangiaceae bacterium]